VFEIFGLRTFSETSATWCAADVSRERQSRRRCASISAARNRDGLLDAAIYPSTVHGSLGAQLGGQGAHNVLSRSQ
jgi:hypothetical protein